MENTYNFIIDRLYQDSLTKCNKNKCIKLLHAIEDYNKKILIVKDDNINKIKIENLTLQNKILDLEKEKNHLITKAENDYDFLLNYDIEVHKKINNEKDELKIKIAILEYQISKQLYNHSNNQLDNPSKKRKFEN